MRRIARIPYEHMNWVWITNYWDVPLRGICKYNNELCSFRGFGWVYGKKMRKYHIFRLTVAEKIAWLFRKLIFELMVGKHWSSYPKRSRYKNKGILTSIYFRIRTIIVRL